MIENIDIDTSGVLYSDTTIDEMGKRLFVEALEVAQGKLTCAEKLGHTEYHVVQMNQKYMPCNC